MRCITIMILALVSACASAPEAPRFVPQPGQGQYVVPEWMQAQPTLRIPNTDVCQSQFYRTLVGRHEGAIYIAGLPGKKRVLKPAFTEEFEEDFPQLPEDRNPYVEVQDYLPGQSLYAPSIRTVGELTALDEFQPDRLTIELDEEGYVQEVVCR